MSDQRDISLPIALLMLLGVVAGYIGLQNKDEMGVVLNWMSFFHQYFGNYLYLALVLSVLNFSVISLYLKRIIGLSKQGSRLRSIKNHAFGNIGSMARGLILLSVLSLVSFIVSDAHFDYVPEELRQSLMFKSLELFLIANFSLLSLFLLYRVLAIYTNIGSKKRKVAVEKFPEEKDSISLGTTTEKDDESKEKWVSIGKKGLNGSILVTGSIGSGKTEGALLPYLRQALKNFKKLSVLILDPKRTFASDSVILIKKERPDLTIRTISLTGEEKFNPVYMEDPLKESRFMDIAEMIRASAINMAGGKSDSPFWEQSSFNLVKNAVVYCAAMKDYFTLRDIYQTMIRANSKKLDQELEQLISPVKTMEPQRQMMLQTVKMAA